MENKNLKKNYELDETLKPSTTETTATPISITSISGASGHADAGTKLQKTDPWSVN